MRFGYFVRNSDNRLQLCSWNMLKLYESLLFNLSRDLYAIFLMYISCEGSIVMSRQDRSLSVRFIWAPLIITAGIDSSLSPIIITPIVAKSSAIAFIVTLNTFPN